MEKIAVIYWSGTGNTEMMAMEIAEGVRTAGAEAVVMTVSDTDARNAATFSKLALGCPAMGAEVLEEMEFEPFFTELEGRLMGHKVLLFGSYGWGDGQWMRDWQVRADNAGANICGDPVLVHETPDTDALALCKAAGEAFAKA